MLGREPAIIVAAIAAIAQGALMLWTNDSTLTQPDLGWVVPLLTLLGGVLTRQKVMPTDTVRDAGYSPEGIKARADDPGVPKHAGP